MARSHSKHTEVTVDGDDLSVYTDTSEFKPTGDSHDVSTYGVDGHVYDRGLTDGTFSMGGVYDTTAGTGPRAVLLPLVKTGVVPLVHKPEGTGAGKPQDSFSALLLSYTESAPVADFRKWSAEWQISGDVTTIAQV